MSDPEEPQEDRDTDFLFARNLDGFDPDGDADDFGDEEDEEDEDDGDDEYASEEPAPARAAPRRAPDLAGVRQTMAERRAERMRILADLETYRENPMTSDIVGDVGLNTPMDELRDRHALCQKRVQARTTTLNRKRLVQMMRRIPIVLSMAMEGMNNNILSAEDQFAIHGLAESMTMAVTDGEFDAINEEIAERYISTRIGALISNPLVAWAWAFGNIVVEHDQLRKEAYRRGELPDPRKQGPRAPPREPSEASETWDDAGAGERRSLLGQRAAPPPMPAPAPRVAPALPAYRPAIEAELSTTTEAGSESDGSDTDSW